MGACCQWRWGEIYRSTCLGIERICFTIDAHKETDRCAQLDFDCPTCELCFEVSARPIAGCDGAGVRIPTTNILDVWVPWCSNYCCRVGICRQVNAAKQHRDGKTHDS